MSRKEIYIVYESFAQAVINDLTTFGFICGAVWFNHNYCGGSYFLNAVILIMFILFIASKGNYKKRIYSKRLVANIIKEEQNDK